MIWLFIDSSGVGGAERHIATIAKSLARRGLEPRIVLYEAHGNNPWLAQLRETGVLVRVLDGTLRGLFAALRRERPDLLHTHGYKAGILGRAAARMLGVPVISTFHSGQRETFPVNVYSFVDEWSSILGGRIAVSEDVRRRLPFPATHVTNYIEKRTRRRRASRCRGRSLSSAASGRRSGRSFSVLWRGARRLDSRGTSTATGRCGRGSSGSSAVSCWRRAMR